MNKEINLLSVLIVISIFCSIMFGITMWWHFQPETQEKIAQYQKEQHEAWIKESQNNFASALNDPNNFFCAWSNLHNACFCGTGNHSVDNLDNLTALPNKTKENCQ